VGSGVVIPVVSLQRLSALYSGPVRIRVHETGVKEEQYPFDLEYLTFNSKLVAKEVFHPLRRSLLCKIEAIQDLTVFFGTD
jgi:hypothetical protein